MTFVVAQLSTFLHSEWRKPVMDIYKILVVLCILVIACLLFRMNATGIAVRESGRNPALVEVHRNAANTVGFATLFLVLLIEVGVRIKGGSDRDTIFWVHAFFAVLYSLCIGALVFGYDGTRLYHKHIAYIAMGSFAGVAFFGIPMLFKRFE